MSKRSTTVARKEVKQGSLETNQMGEYLAKELEWFPTYPDRLLSSVRWKAMKDFQRGWYWHLMLLMTRSKPLGYLPFDGQLWVLAGAHTKQYWDLHAGLVLACFKVREFDGQKWVYSEPLLKVLNEQQYKHDQAVEKGRFGSHVKLKRSSASNKYSFEFEEIWNNNTWKCVAKSQAFKAFTKALENIQQEKKCTRDQAISFLADAMEEFKTSPAGRAHGMFDGYSPPYPASWLNAQRYFDDRRTWRPGAKQAEEQKPRATVAHAGCPACAETPGFRRVGNRLSPCDCRQRVSAATAQA